jgi:hypothetical protein
LVPIYQTTWYHVTEDSYLNKQKQEITQPHVLQILYKQNPNFKNLAEHTLTTPECLDDM